MAISDVKEYAHLTPEDVEAIGKEFDAIRAEIEEARGADDAEYIRRIIGIQRKLAAGGRAALFLSIFPPAWLAGATMLAFAKILENMELGHNIMHGQWDWMNDPEIHSTTWEWDTIEPSVQWKHHHNYIHHHFTNIIGKDRDIGYGILRMAPEQKWSPASIGNPIYNAALGFLFEWGVGLHDLEIERLRNGTKDRGEALAALKQIGRKAARQAGKDYLYFPLLTGLQFPFTLAANATANIARNIWSYLIIFCNHFPDGALHFTEEELENETQYEWYLRQVLGAANIDGSPLFSLIAGNLDFQIEHHLYPDLPSNRYREISVKVRDICDRFGLPYTTGPLRKQYGQVLRTVLKMALPNTKAFSNDPDPDSAEKPRPHDVGPSDNPAQAARSGGTVRLTVFPA
jgi:fatty acid desaturase